MPGCLKPYSYFVLRCGTGLNLLQQRMEAIHIVRDGEHIRQDFALRTVDKAVVLVLCHIDTNGNDHFKNIQR